jgi:hypothetical protein
MERALELFTPSRPRRGIAALWFGFAIAAGVVLYLVDPASSRLFPECPFRALTGLLCPGCGTTRALHQLMHGELAAAIRLNPMLLVVVPIFGYSAISGFNLVARGVPLPRPRIPAIWIWALLTGIMGFWLLRNVAWLS